MFTSDFLLTYFMFTFNLFLVYSVLIFIYFLFTLIFTFYLFLIYSKLYSLEYSVFLYFFLTLSSFFIYSYLLCIQFLSIFYLLCIALIGLSTLGPSQDHESESRDACGHHIRCQYWNKSKKLRWPKLGTRGPPERLSRKTPAGAWSGSLDHRRRPENSTICKSQCVLQNFHQIYVSPCICGGLCHIGDLVQHPQTCQVVALASGFLQGDNNSCV